jgi:hypothetical protein
VPEQHPTHETQVLQPVPPLAAEQPTRRRRSALVPLVILAAALVALLAVVVAVTIGNDDPRADPPGDGATSESDPTDEPPAGPNAADMKAFITDYLATAPSSPETTYEMLTPAFQEDSGFLEGYAGFWGTIETAEPVEIAADPQALTVAYTVDYVAENGEETTDDVVLRLVYEDGRYLIAEEP